MYQSKLNHFSSTFTTQKTRLLNLNITKNAKMAVEMSEKIDGLTKLMESKSAEESRVIDAVDNAGGPDEVLKVS
jgi:hypothetical protein